MTRVINRETLLKARVQYGHLSKKWHPSFAPFILMKKQRMHVIDLDKTLKCLAIAGEEIKKLVQEGKKILFVGRKKQAQAIVEETAKRLNQPYVTERWLGGTLTNFGTIKKLLRKLGAMEEEMKSESYKHLTKREKLIYIRKKNKQENLLSGLFSINRLPAAIFVVDVNREMTAIKEARKLGILVFALADTTAPTHLIDYIIPANDDAITSIKIILLYLESQIAEGSQLWEKRKAQEEQDSLPDKEQKETTKKPNKREFIKPTAFINRKTK
ncbi:MAG: 30S ribosomal protein S2 [Bacteroidota bacterium]